MARRNYRPAFPDPTHSQNEDEPGTDAWRSAAEIIDWTELGDSIWTRSRPLSNNTMQRIAEGICQHSADSLAPYAHAIAEITPEDVEALYEQVLECHRHHSLRPAHFSNSLN